MNGRFTLTYPYGFHKYLVEASRLTKDNGLTRLAGYPTQRASRRARTDEGIRVNGQFLHTSLVAQDTAFGAFATGVDGQDSQLSSFFQHMKTKRIDGSTLSGSRHTTDTNTHRISRIRQTLLDDFLCYDLMLRLRTFHQSNRLAQHGHIALDNAVHKLIHRIFTTTDFLAQFQIRIDGRRLFDACIHGQAFIFFTIFRVFHHSILF